MKEKEYLSSYLEGITNMASSISKSIGHSYVKVEAYDINTFQKEFKNFYHLKEDLKLIETNKSFKSTLLNWFHLKINEEPKVYLPEEKLVTILDEKRMDFYFLESLFFVECKKYIFVFLLGNNE